MSEQQAATAPLHVRAVSAASGSLLTSLALTPLDVVKTRLQARQPENSIHPGITSAKCSLCDCYFMDNGVMEYRVKKSSVRFFSNSTAASPAAVQGTVQEMRQIFRAEGMAGLYTGLAPSLIMAVPSTMLYFTLYDELFSTLRTLHSRKLDPFAPMIAGATARLCAATTIAPFELVRTQLQSLSASEQVSIARMFRRNIRATGIRSLWNGIGPTLWRDVPFSALYWGAYQNLRVWLGHNERLARSPLLASFIAGATAGMCAAVATHPFDVVKTQRQVIALARPQHNDLGTLNALRAILRDEGPSGLFRGVVPRVVKVAPACAIMIATYEAGKAAFTSQLPHHEQSLR